MAIPSPEIGQLVRVRQRHYLVENVAPPPVVGDATLVGLACVDDDAQGQPLAVLWEHEPDARIIDAEAWRNLGERGFDRPPVFAAYLHTLRWNCVTATDPSLLQSPFRAGIKIEAYQLDPLRKALRLPRVNLFIADDVGLGKTIEAGLILRELLLRRRIDTVVVSCPPSMLNQWQDELEARFGLSFVILDRAYVAAMRRERGFTVNPWTTHSRFLISHRLLIDEDYAANLRLMLGEFRPRSLLILDEAHHAAPSSGAKYATDSQITKSVRDLAGRFEHRLFLSATPHNGRSNSFSALLEILDPQRFCRGVPVRRGELGEIMVRRLKEDLRQIEGGFPKRNVDQVIIDGLPEDAPELLLARLLEEYGDKREKRLAGAPRREQTASALVVTGLQQRLLSSVEAFARTLKVHKRGVERALEELKKGEKPLAPVVAGLERIVEGVGADDDEASLDEEQQQAEDDVLFEEATRAGMGATAAALDAIRAEIDLVERMARIAEEHRFRPDARIVHLLAWIDRMMCPGAGKPPTLGRVPQWNTERVLIFTEWEDTRRYVQQQLAEALAHTDLADERIAVFTGSTSGDARGAIKHAFNADPAKVPLRILIATDAAREGLNLQQHCRHLFHFDVPWNPSRLEQRNGRIDRKLQPAPEVHCHYFVYRQRPADRVLSVLVRKTEMIRKQLGSLAQVLDARLADMLKKSGIRDRDEDRLKRDIEAANVDDRRDTVEEELESARERQDDLRTEIERLRTQLERSQKTMSIDRQQLRDALSVSLGLARAPALQRNPGDYTDPDGRWSFPTDALAADPGWAPALDTLRDRRLRGEKLWEWRRRAPIRPVVFEDPGNLSEEVVQLHLEHRVVQRLLGRFTSQGLVHFDMSRACLAIAEDAIPRVVLIGRLSLYGPNAARLHEELVPVAARWTDAAVRRSPLTPYGRETEARTLELLDKALADAASRQVPDPVSRQLAASGQRDITELLPHLERRGQEYRTDAEAKLAERGRRESDDMRRLLEAQRKRIEEQAKRVDQRQYVLDLESERKQLESDRRHWDRRLASIAGELAREPKRILEGYSVRAARLEPVGLVYLWPASG
jgi:SNF2 family DNA or RNA helicase